MEQSNNLLDFPLQMKPSDTPMSDFQLICQVRVKLTNKLNRVQRGEHQLTEEDKQDIINANRIFEEAGHRTIDVDLTQY